MRNIQLLFRHCFLLGIILLTGCANLNDPYYQPSSSPYYGGYDSGYYDDRERWEIERERRRLEDERRRLERERDRHDDWHDDHDHNHNRPRPVPRPTPPPAVERCPSGFSPSENRCSAEERKRGCKDIRLPSGLGCVRR